MKTERTHRSDRPNQQPVVIAAVAAGVLMLACGSGYRVLAARLAAPVGTMPIAPADLERLPAEIAGWTGQDVPIDEAVARATDTDARISRRYSHPGGLESVYLYVACGVKARDLMPHRPEVCYTGNGWTLVDRRSTDVPLSDGSKLPCNLLHFSRGSLQGGEVVVLDYYIVDGQYCPDVSLLRSKAWRGSGTVRYVAQVEVVSTITATASADSAAKLACTFAAESASSIAQLFGGAPANPGPAESHGSPKGE